MNDFTFACPNCGQQLSAALSYVGGQTTCPACHKAIIVPPAPGTSPTATSAAPPPSPSGSGAPPPLGSVPPPLGGSAAPPPPSSRFPGTPQPFSTGPARKTSGLALASLICSIGSFVCIPLGFIPGIICGHMAHNRIKEDPSLEGRGMATAGTIIGYVSLGIHILVIIGVAVALIFALNTRKAPTRFISPVPTPPVAPSEPVEAQPAPDQVMNATPDGSGWTMDLKDVSIPEHAVSGRVHGSDFSVDKTVVEGGWIKFKKGSGFFADLEVDVVPFQQDLSGKTFDVEPAEKFGNHPHIWVHWKDARDRPAQTNYMAGYAMHLEFSQPENGKLAGKIYLCLPDQQKSFIRGAFEIPAGK